MFRYALTVLHQLSKASGSRSSLVPENIGGVGIFMLSLGAAGPAGAGAAGAASPSGAGPASSPILLPPGVESLGLGGSNAGLVDGPGDSGNPPGGVEDFSSSSSSELSCPASFANCLAAASVSSGGSVLGPASDPFFGGTGPRLGTCFPDLVVRNSSIVRSVYPSVVPGSATFNTRILKLKKCNLFWPGPDRLLKGFSIDCKVPKSGN